MTFREALFFTGKCLTLESVPERAVEVREAIIRDEVNWERIVQVSSGQLVLPALHIQLQRAGLEKELPDDLVEYMNSITQLNRERNRQIIEQSHEIARILNKCDSAPIFLKGAAHLLYPLYQDIGERMVGDIDFLILEADLLKAVHHLGEIGYTPLTDFNPYRLKTEKHYPRLVRYDYPAAAEVHIRVVPSPHDMRFSSVEIDREKQKLPGDLRMFIPSNRHLIIHNCLNAQINNKAYLYGNPNMRQMYDLLLLAKLENPQKVITEFSFFQHKTNSWLGMTTDLLGCPEIIAFKKTWQSRILLMPFKLSLANQRYLFVTFKILAYLIIRFSRYVTIPAKAIFSKEERKDLFLRLSDPKWYGQHLNSYRNLFKYSHG